MDFYRQRMQRAGKSDGSLTMCCHLQFKHFDEFVQFWRWQTVTALDVITEIYLFGIAIYMGQGLQLPFNKKVVVFTAFSLRLL